MTAVTYLTRHRRPGIVILCSIVAVLSMLFVLPPAIASAADSGAQAVDECNPTASNGCVNGILQDADKKPIADVTITLSGKATAETKTAADGKWAFSVADDGDYTVTIDASVAKEHGLKASSATVTIRKASFDKQRGVVRFDQAGDSTGSGTSGTSGSSGSANGTKGATGTSGSTAATQSQGAVRRKRDDRKCRTAPFAGGTRVEYMRSVRGRCVERVVKHTSFTGEKVDFSGELKRGRASFVN